MKKLITLALLLLSAAAFARTRAEVQKEINELGKKYWIFPFSKEYRTFEAESLKEDAAYQAAKKAEDEANNARIAWISESMSKDAEGKKLVDAVAAAEKKFAEAESTPDRKAAFAEVRAAKRERDAYARKNGFMNRRDPEYGKLDAAWREANKKRIMICVEAMLKSDNEEVKKAAQDYKEVSASLDKLYEELKTASK